MPRLAVVLALALFALGCKKPEASPPEPVALAPAPTPEGHIADVVVPSPDALWRHLQRGVGGLLAILPPTFGGLLSSAAGLDPGLGSLIDGAAPAFAVVADADGDSWTFLLAAKLVDPRHARDALVLSETARFTARPPDPGQPTQGDDAILVLVPKGLPGTFALGLSPNGYLLVAHDEAALARLGPYATRTLPLRPLPPNGLVAEAHHEALAGTVHAEAARRWSNWKREALEDDTNQRSKHGGQPPDFGDPPAILATLDSTVDRMLRAGADLDLVRLVLDADDDAVHGALSLAPAAPGAAGVGPATELLQAMSVGDASPLAELPADTAMALMTRADAPTRATDTATLESSLARALGPRLQADDARRIHAALTGWQAARGDWLSLAVGTDDARTDGGAARGIHLAVRTPAADAEKATRAVRECLGLAALPVFSGPLRSFLRVRDVSVQEAELAGLHQGGIAILAREKSDDRRDKRGLAAWGLGWGVAGGELRLVAALADDVRPALVAKPEGTLGDDPKLAAALQGLKADVTFALVAQPFARTSPAGGPARMILAWGRRGHDGWAQIDVSDSLLRELVKRQSGL